MANVLEILIKAKNEFTAEFEKATGSLGQFTTAAGLAGAAGAAAGLAIVAAMQQAQGAIVSNTLKMADNVEMLDRMANYTGLSVQQLDLFRQQLDDDGLSADQLSQALRYMREQLNAGNKELATLGITSGDTFTALQQMAAAMDRAKTVGERAAVASAALGMRNAELAASVATAAANMNGMQAEALANGTALTDDYLATMRDLGNTMDDFAKTQKAFAMASAQFFGPMIDGATKFLIALNNIRMAYGQLPKRIADAMFGTDFRAMMMPAHGDGFEVKRQEFGGDSRTRLPGRDLGQWFTGQGGLSIMSRLPDGFSDTSKMFMRVMGGKNADGGQSDESVKTPLEKSFNAIREAAERFGASFQSSLTATLTRALSITTQSNNLIVQSFVSLANAVVATIAEMMAEAAAAGLVKLAVQVGVGFATGGAGAPVAAMRMAPVAAGRSTGNTFNISAINARSVIEDLTNPTGSLRRANDRIRDIAVAQMG